MMSPRIIPVTVDVIIKGQFFVFLDTAICKNAHTNTTAHSPFRYITVWVTTVICEPAYSALLGSIDELGERNR